MWNSILPPLGRASAGWRRSSASTPWNDCVEIWVSQDKVRVRDSKGDQGVELRFSSHSWSGFLSHWSHSG